MYNILSVDELGTTKIELVNMLKSFETKIIDARDKKEAESILKEKKIPISMIIWTINSVDLKDFDAIKELKEKEYGRQIPVIIISKLTDKKYIIKAIESGAVDYIAKPYDENAVLKKICKILGISFEKTAKKVFDEDFVTFSFDEMFSRELKAASRGGYPLTLIMVRLESTDEVDTYQKKHDDALSIFNRLLKNSLRSTDSSFIYSENSLMVILPFADKNGATVLEGKILNIFINSSIIHKKNNNFKISLASVTFPVDGKIKEKLIEKLEESINANG